MRKFNINVNGNSYEVEVEEIRNAAEPQRQAPVARATATTSVESPPKVPTPKNEKKEVTVSVGQEVVKAPMPGNVWKVVVSEGQVVKSGDVLLILEAMKMENEILAPRDGKVASITTLTGATVNTGDSLVIID